jgi:hypothetical protein
MSDDLDQMHVRAADANLQQLVTDLSSEFDDQCQRRHIAGAEKYGPVNFLAPGNDLYEMLQEEIVDAANYCRYLYIRLALMQEAVKSRPTDTSRNTPRGPQGIITPLAGEK